MMAEETAAPTSALPAATVRPGTSALENNGGGNSIMDIGDEVNDFSLNSQLGVIKFRDIIDGKWCMLITVCAAFDPVGTTELGILCKLADEFNARDLVILVVCCDTMVNIRKWVREIEELQDCKINFPIMSDTDCTILKRYGCARMVPPYYHLEPHTLGMFMVDTDKLIRCSTRHSTSTGRNLYEQLRMYDALQLTTYNKCVTPANWGAGQDVLVHPNCSNEEASSLFPKGFAEIKPWFRLTSSPEVIVPLGKTGKK